MHGSSVKTFKQKKIFWQIDNYGDNHKEREDGSHINVGGDDDDDGGGGDDDADGGNDDDGDDGDETINRMKVAWHINNSSRYIIHST